MDANFDQHISDTAFLVNESRARKPHISCDRYARTWVPEEARERVRDLWNDFAAHVYPSDDLELSIRNRFFIERINSFIASYTDPVFVNLGAGFTSYPFLMEQSIDCYEIDFPHVIKFKQQRLEHLVSNREIPARDISFTALDLRSDAAPLVLTRLLKGRLKNAPSFVLLEGVSYYLNVRALDALFSTMAGLQTPGSVFAFDFWRPDLLQHPVFLRLQAFFHQRFGFEVADYCLIDEAYIESIAAYSAAEITDVSAMESVYADTRQLAEYEQILPENYAVLARR